MYAQPRRCENVPLRRIPGSAWLTIAVLAASGLLVTWWLVDPEPVATVPAAHQGVGDNPTTDAASGPSPEPRTDPHSLAADVPTPAAVLADPQCRMVVGQRTASDTAVVYLPLGEGAWFAVVNTFGVVFDGTLPFVPERPAIGKRPDGTILAGFSLEGELTIVHGGSVIYELDDAWSFDIANDGSSFFAVEPMAGDAARLVVRNLDLREEHHFDLGTALTWTNKRLDHHLSYSPDLAEVKVVVVGGTGGTNRFYAVAGGRHREVLVDPEDGTVPTGIAIFESSEVSYHARTEGDVERNPLDQTWTIAKVRHEYDRRVATSTEIWASELLFLNPPSIQRSDDGAWLALSDGVSGIVVLDTTQGNTVFTYPRRRMIARMEIEGRWRSVLFRSRTTAERYSARFVDSRLLVYRWTDNEPDAALVETYVLSRIKENVRLIERQEVRKVPEESESSFAIRTELDPRYPISCTDHAVLDRRLVIRDGRLTYQPR